MERTLEPDQALLTGITGVDRLRLADGNAHLDGTSEGRILIPELRVVTGAKMAVRLAAKKAHLGRGAAFVHARQRSGGKITGGVSLQLQRRVRKGRRVRTRLEKDRLVIGR
jgi:hypothetical protein